jgi:hypothetical protein
MLFSVPRAAAPTSFQVISKAKFIRFKVASLSDNFLPGYDPWFKEFFVLRYANATDATNDANRVDEIRFPNTSFDYGEELVTGSTYYFRIAYYDDYENLSFLSSTVSVVYRGATTADLEDDAVIDRKRKTGDSSNMMRNPEMDDVSLWLGSPGTLGSIASAVAWASSNYLHLTASTAQIIIWSGKSGAADVSVKAGKKYYFAGTIGTTSGVTVGATLYAQWFSMDAAGVLTFISENLIGRYDGTTWGRVENIFQAPANARRVRFRALKEISASAATLIWAEADIHLATDEELLADDAVSERKVKDNAISDRKRKQRDGSNMVRNADADDITLWSGVGGALTSVATGVAAASQNYIRLAPSTAQTDIDSGAAGDADIPLRAGKKYYVSAFIGTDSGLTVACELYLQTFSMTAGGVKTLVASHLIGTYNGTTWASVNAIITTGASVRRGRLKARKLASAGSASNIIFEPDVHLATDTELLADGAVTEPKADQTLPGTPVAPTLSTYVGDIDGDGTIQTGLNAAITAPAGVKVVGYEVDMQWSDVIGGTYASRKRETIPSEDPQTVGTITNFPFSANQRRFWKVRVRAIAFGGKKGAWSTLSSGLQPLQYSGTVQAGGAMGVVPIAKGFELTWPRCTDLTYKETILYVGGVEFKRVKGSAFTDMTVRTAGVSYTFSHAHVDRQGRVGAVSSGVAGTYRLGTSADVSIGKGSNLLINTNLTLYVPTGAVPQYWAERDDPNNVTDVTTWLDGNAWAPRGENVLVLQQTTGTSGSYADIQQTDANGNARKIPVKANGWYEYHLLTGAHRCTARAFIYWFTAADVFISASGTDLNASEAAGGQSLTGYKQIGVIAQAPATAAYAIIIVRKNNTDVGASPANSYGFFTHMFFGEAVVGQTEYSPWAENGNLLVTESITDPGAPNAPSAALATVTTDIDGDGTIDAGFRVTASLPASGKKVKWYEIEVQRSTTVGGTYVYWKTFTFLAEKVGTTLFDFKANRTYFHKIKIRGIGFNGNESGYSGLTAPGLQPPQYLGTVQAGGAGTLTPIAKGFFYEYPKCTDINYKETIIYVNGVEIKRIKGSSYQDMTPRTEGVSYTYTHRHVDTQNREGALSSGSAGVFRLTITADIADAAVTADEIAPAAVSPSKLLRPLTSNLVKDYDLIEKANLRFTQFLTSAGVGTEEPMADANVVQMPNPSSGPVGPSQYKFRMTAPAVSYTLRVETERLSPVEEGLWYEFSCYLNAVVSWATVNQITMRMMWWTIDGAGNIVALSESAVTVGTLGASSFFQGGVVAPANAVYASIKMSIQAVSGQLVQMDFGSPKIRQLPIWGDYTDVLKSYETSAVTFGNTGGTMVATITGIFRKNIQPIKSIEVFARFKNASGAAGDFTVTCEYSVKGSGIWNTLGDPYNLYPVGNGGFFQGEFLIEPTIGALSEAIDTVDFRIVADPDQAGNDVRQRYMRVRVFYS